MNEPLKEPLVIYSEILQDKICIIPDITFKSQVPQGLVFYTQAEVDKLEKCLPENLKTIHFAKKIFGGEVR